VDWAVVGRRKGRRVRRVVLGRSILKILMLRNATEQRKKARKAP
jgi:hypothetical protein